ncbi:MAG: PIG-L family deacetylase [Acidobacteriota bacterium]|nr:PIG-L family deacetylase [Acidobacteriota bacterium]
MLSLSDCKVIAIAPHIDDVELGAGATIHHLTKSKSNKVYYVGLSLPPLVDSNTFHEEFSESTQILGLDPERIILRNFNPRNLFDARSEILQLFYDLNKELKPDLVIIPNSQDIHQSHEVVFAEARRAFKYTTILGYELPWNSLDFSMDVFITVDREDVEAKVAAINAYRTQKNRMFFANDIVGDLARVRGKQIGREYAECFELTRLIV